MDHETWGACTHAGAVRTVNEDAHLVAPPVFAVADGMGGHVSGRRASTLCIDTLAAALGPGPLTRQDVLHAMRLADAAVSAGASTPEHQGMGTTLCLLAVVGDAARGRRVLVANVGDSRVLRLRRGSVDQLTVDHTVVQELVDQGALAPTDAASHAERHVVTRALGTGHRLDIDWWLLPAEPDDIYLLASDGLTNEVPPARIRQIIGSSPTAHHAAEELVAAAIAAGGRDNVTAVVVVPGVAPGGDTGPDLDDADTEPPLELSL